MNSFRTSAIICLALFLASFAPVLSDAGTPTAMDLLVDYTGATVSVDSYPYQEHVAMLQSIPVPSHDYLKGEAEPGTVVFASYSGDGIGVFVEIHEYDSPEDARREYSLQNPSNRIGDIFVRFSTEEWMVQQGRFLIFVFCYPGYGEDGHDEARLMLVDLLQVLGERLIEVVSWETVQDLPTVEFRGAIAWGIEAGDEITWRSGGSTMYSSDDEEVLAWEIVSISQDNLAVLMRRSRDRLEAIQQPGWASGRQLVYTEYLEIPHHEYSWSTADDTGLKFGDTNALIFPLFRGSENLKEIVEKQIARLPERRTTDGTESISVYGKTSSGMGFTPLKNEWLDITVHKGTGVVTSYDWYYHDREYSVQTSKSFALIDTNFAMGERPPGGNGGEIGEVVLPLLLILPFKLIQNKRAGPSGRSLMA